MGKPHAGNLRRAHSFSGFNAVIVNLAGLTPEHQARCLANIENNIRTLKAYLEENIRQKESEPDIPETGMAVLRQQYAWLRL